MAMHRKPRPILLALAVLGLALSGCLEGGSETPDESSGGAGAPAQKVPLVIYVDNGAMRDAELSLRINDAEPMQVQVPYTGSQPNVKRAFEGEVDAGTLTLQATAPSGETETRTFTLDGQGWIVVAYQDDGAIEMWQTESEPLFD